MTCTATRRVLGVYEKSQAQALSNRCCGLAMCNGTTSPFAALDVAIGKAKRFRCRRSEEFRKCLNYGNVPLGHEIHNHATRKTARDRFAKRQHVRFTRLAD